MPTPVAVSTLATEDIPAGGWMEPTGSADAEGRPLVRKATRTGLVGFVAVADIPASDGSTPSAGQGYYPFAESVPLAVHPSDSITVADTLGPKADDWYCRTGQPGFRPVGPAFAGFVPAVADGGGGGGTPLIPVRQTAATATAAGTFTAGKVRVYSAGTLTDGTEDVVFTPQDAGMLQKTNTVWWCVDTGDRDGSSRRKLVGVVPPRIKRRVLVECVGSAPQYADVWVPNVN